MENEENQDINPEEEVDEEVTEEELVEAEEADEPVEEPEEESDETDWKAEALKYKAIAIRNKKKKDINTKINSKLETKAQSPDVTDRISNLELAEQKRQFGYEHGLSPVETDRVFSLDSEPSEKTLKDTFVKAGLKALREKAKLANNSPAISAKSSVLNRVKIKDMSTEDKDKALQNFIKSKAK